jgi:hypothetical protein
MAFSFRLSGLVNGGSITLATMDDREVIDYFHIGLETHEVVFAEGAAAETLLVTSDRESFANFVEYERMYGAERPPMKPFAPTILQGRPWRSRTVASKGGFAGCRRP